MESYMDIAGTQVNDRLVQAFSLLTRDERQLVTAMLAGNHPANLSYLREPMIRALTIADVRKPFGPAGSRNAR